MLCPFNMLRIKLHITQEIFDRLPSWIFSRRTLFILSYSILVRLQHSGISSYKEIRSWCWWPIRSAACICRPTKCTTKLAHGADVKYPSDSDLLANSRYHLRYYHPNIIQHKYCLIFMGVLPHARESPASCNNFIQGRQDCSSVSELERI